MIAVIAGLPRGDHLAAVPVAGGRIRSATPGGAQHYLPADGAVLTFPMLQFSCWALCMLGTLWLVWRALQFHPGGRLGIGVLSLYAWSLLSMRPRWPAPRCCPSGCSRP